MTRIYTKRPQDDLSITFDLRGFVARMVSEGTAAEEISFSVRQAPGFDVASSMAVRGLVACEVSGGDLGKFYHLGVDATAPDGSSQSEVCRVRVRDASLYDVLPPESEVPLSLGAVPVSPGVLGLDGAVLGLDSLELALV
jgi:hypothetical protein